VRTWSFDLQALVTDSTLRQAEISPLHFPTVVAADRRGALSAAASWTRRFVFARVGAVPDFLGFARRAIAGMSTARRGAGTRAATPACGRRAVAIKTVVKAASITATTSARIAPVAA
jgi:hypothetical protein